MIKSRVDFVGKSGSGEFAIPSETERAPAATETLGLLVLDPGAHVEHTER